MGDLKEFTDQLPGYYICEKCLWYKGMRVDIDHVDNDLKNPLNYETALKKMVDKAKTAVRGV